MSLFRHAPCARPAPLSTRATQEVYLDMRPAPLSYEGAARSLVRTVDTRESAS